MATMNQPMAGVCIVGTDTGVGKTFLTARIARQLLDDGVSVGIYKPVCSGATDPASPNPAWDDVDLHAEALGHQFPRERICPQRFLAPLAPPVAARLENRRVDAELLRHGIDWWRDRVELLLIEGVGGLYCPITEDWTLADLLEDWPFPVIVVGHLGLGTINHTLLTVEAAMRRGLSVAGVLLNEAFPGGGGRAAASNPEEIARRCPVPVLAVIPYQEPRGLLPLPETSTINWQAISRRNLPNEGI
jgi:dethiobiotin synthetase